MHTHEHISNVTEFDHHCFLPSECWGLKTFHNFLQIRAQTYWDVRVHILFIFTSLIDMGNSRLEKLWKAFCSKPWFLTLTNGESRRKGSTWKLNSGSSMMGTQASWPQARTLPSTASARPCTTNHSAEGLLSASPPKVRGKGGEVCNWHSVWHQRWTEWVRLRMMPV